MLNHITPSYYPLHFPENMSGKLTYKIIQKTDYIRTDGTAALYVQVFLSKKRKRLPLNIFVSPNDFDKINQRVRGKSQLAKDYNLIINKMLADINAIEINYRLAGDTLTMDKLLDSLTNPTAKVDFILFWESELEKQKDILKIGSYKQQMSTLAKLREFRKSILFKDIDHEFLNDFKIFCKKVLKNKDTTIQTALKNLKKFLHLANKKGIATELDYSEISVKSIIGERTFLTEDEIKILYKYYNSEFISEGNKNILDRFFFACFTGLRISDVQNLKSENIIADHLAFTSVKTGKFQRIKLNETAKRFIGIDAPKPFKGEFSDQHINKQLKQIAKAVNLKKHLTFHVARHSFATNFLIKGGRIENLQKLLGHSSIKETMIYVHIVDNIMNADIDNMNSII